MHISNDPERNCRKFRLTVFRFFVRVVTATVLFYSLPPRHIDAAAGMLDATFGTGGKVTTNFGGDELINAVVLQSDGKIVTVGAIFVPGPGFNPNFAIARYNTDGSLDTNFDVDGKVTTDFLGFEDKAEAVAIQPDGKIVVAGSAAANAPGGDIPVTRFALARYNSDGSLDPTFDGDGKLTTSFINGFESAFDLSIQSDGKIIAVGVASNQTGGGVALARYNSDGSLDPSFGTGGKVNMSLGGGGGNAQAIVLQSDGKIVIGGYARAASVSFDEDFMIARFTSSGQFDTSFGTGGVAFTDMSGGDDDAALDIALQSDGKIVAVGYAVQQTGDFAMIRYTIGGSLDSGFGNGGKVITEFGDQYTSANSIVIQADGKLVTAGQAFDNFSQFPLNFALTRHNTNGGLDTGFGTGGKLTTDFNNSIDRAHAVVLQPDGKIIAAGLSGSDFALARYVVASAPAVTVSGRVTTPDGRGLRNAVVAIIDSLGVRRTATTSSFGLYSFDNVVTGETYIISVSSKRYRFAPRNLLVNDNLRDVDFVGLE